MSKVSLDDIFSLLDKNNLNYEYVGNYNLEFNSISSLGNLDKESISFIEVWISVPSKEVLNLIE